MTNEENKTNTISRRSFLKRSGVLAGGIIGGKLFANSDTQSPPSQYLTLDQATKVYKDLKLEVTKKYDEAKVQNKPLRIFILEEHASNNALAYEIMLLDIASQLGIRTFLPELGGTEPKSIIASKADPASIQFKKKELLIEATNRKFEIEDIDTSFGTNANFLEIFQNRTKILAENNIKKRYPGSHIQVKIVPSDKEDQEKLLFGFSFKGDLPNTGESVELIQKTINKLAFDSQNTVWEQLIDERNTAMLSNIHEHGSAVITTGISHGVGLLTPLRNKHEIDVTFNVTDKGKFVRDKSNFLTNEGIIKRTNWANDPAHAIPYTKFNNKDFSPENLVQFVNSAIERAQGRGR